jgi:regulator of nonsense transcripts 1
MHESLIKVSNQQFYDNAIMTGYVKKPKMKFLGLESPFMFIDVNQGEEMLDGTSLYNEKEIEAVTEFLKHTIGIFQKQKQTNFRPNDIAIITPYAAQRKRLKDALKKVQVGGETHNYKNYVFSIDQSQGREFGIVFLSTVRTTYGKFLSDKRRINVALTRAKHGMVVFGNRQNLS